MAFIVVGASPGLRITSLESFISRKPTSRAEKPHQEARSQTLCSIAKEAESKNVPRRNLLKFAAITAISATLAFLPSHNAVHALSKKRIMAKAGPSFQLKDGVTAREIKEGTGYSAQNGDSVAIHYSLYYDDLEVESSRESSGLAARPVGFTFGTQEGPGAILKGIEIGVDGMKVGGLRLVTVPPELAYGKRGKPPLIPPDATVEFAISLLSCKRAGTNPNSTFNRKSQVY